MDGVDGQTPSEGQGIPPAQVWVRVQDSPAFIRQDPCSQVSREAQETVGHPCGHVPVVGQEVPSAQSVPEVHPPPLGMVQIPLLLQRSPDPQSASRVQGEGQVPVGGQGSPPAQVSPGWHAVFVGIVHLPLSQRCSGLQEEQAVGHVPDAGQGLPSEQTGVPHLVPPMVTQSPREHTSEEISDPATVLLH